jgi:hydrogenase maturation protein HypF
MAEEAVGLQVWVKGIVQGVGFRPFIYSLALKHVLTGWVRNTSSGVEIVVNGLAPSVQSFVAAVASDYPPLARIDQIETQPCPPDHFQRFEILASQPQPGQFMPVSPDVCICPDCRRELADPSDRRYRYPFINCTNCGPRFTIIRDIPYDRPKTSMASFKMCPECQAEYDDPLNRRFHAQPTACPVCGPQAAFSAGGVCLAEREDAIQIARSQLSAGKIIAVKGLGGYLLACDASNPAAVAELRRRKQRNDKGFALMAYDLQTIQQHCEVSDPERELLLSHASPIVLLKRRSSSQIAASVAPHQTTLGFMLPYTPLHLLLLEPSPAYPSVLVMTSGNRSEEPIAFRDEDAFERLAGIADSFLTHDRPIHMRIDDSVYRVVRGRPYPLRRARGYAPDSIPLPQDVPPILATGAELKNTFCLTRDRYAFLSHHIGDLENYETLISFEEGITHYETLFRIQPEHIVCDQHPDYLASRYAHERAARQSLPLIEVQHHHAHLAACLADNGWDTTDSVIGLSYDGTGLGTDRAIWGGEVLLGGYLGYQRLFHLAYTPLPGGDAATRKPARMALAHLWQAGLEWEPDLPPVAALCAEDRTVLRTQLEKHLNTPATSSMGRLFDAAAAMIGIRQTATYEGQAAIELEALCAPHETGHYAFDLQPGIFDPAPLWQAYLADWRQGTPAAILAARFHNSVIELNLQVCQAVRQAQGLETVVLSGGVWQNCYLLEHTIARLENAGFKVLWHHQVPANDGGLALGQAMIAAYAVQ